jgi:hypothetical protein
MTETESRQDGAPTNLKTSLFPSVRGKGLFFAPGGYSNENNLIVKID